MLKTQPTGEVRFERLNAIDKLIASLEASYVTKPSLPLSLTIQSLKARRKGLQEELETTK